MSEMNLDCLRRQVEKYVACGEWQDAVFWSEKLLSLPQGRPIDLIYFIRSLVEIEQFHRALSCLKRVIFPEVIILQDGVASTSTDQESMNSDQQLQFNGVKEATMTRSHHMFFNIEENDDFEQFSARLLDGDLSKKHKLLKYLASKCLLGMKMYDETIKLASLALNCDPFLMNSSTVATTSGLHDKICSENNREECELYDNLSKEWKTDAGLYLQLGVAYESIDNRVQARLAYEKCLKKDVYRFEALKRLNDRHLLTEIQKTSLLNDLPFKEQCSDEEGQLLRIIYSAMIKQQPLSTFQPQTADQKERTELIEIRNVLSHNPSLQVAEAQFKYEKSDYRRAYELTSKILRQEQFRFDCLAVHICCLVKLDNANELFKLAHKLVDFYPENALSWFCVACYYWCSGQIDAAKRFFDKCTCLEPNSGQFWIAYGHAFAAEQEHDQAMNCYVKAAKIMTNSFVPQLYVGLEYAATNNLKLAARFLNEALTMAPDDAHILHEIGVLLYRQENYSEAEQNFRAAVESVIKTQEITFRSTQSSLSFGGGRCFTNADVSWEPLLNNLGHTLRKLKRYDEALEWHTKALKLLPRDASTLASIGYCHMFLENFDAAVDYFHQSLSIKRDDTFIAGILSKCMEIMCDSTYTARTFLLGTSTTFSMMQQQQNSNISMASTSLSKDDMDLTPIT